MAKRKSIFTPQAVRLQHEVENSTTMTDEMKKRAKEDILVAVTRSRGPSERRRALNAVGFILGLRKRSSK